MNEPNLSLAQVIRSIHRELLESQAEREKDGLDPLFVVDSLTVDLSFVVDTTREGSGELNLKIVSAGGGVKYTNEEVQRISLQLRRFDHAAAPEPRADKSVSKEGNISEGGLPGPMIPAGGLPINSTRGTLPRVGRFTKPKK